MARALSAARPVASVRLTVRRTAIVALGAVSVSAGACAAVLAGSGASPPSEIVFSANRSPLLNGQVYRASPGGRVIDLGRSPAGSWDPAVSPDGKWVAFTSARSGFTAVWAVQLDGRGLQRLTPRIAGQADIPASDLQFTWSPDGRELAASGPRSLAAPSTRETAGSSRSTTGTDGCSAPGRSRASSESRELALKEAPAQVGVDRTAPRA